MRPFVSAEGFSVRGLLFTSLEHIEIPSGFSSKRASLHKGFSSQGLLFTRTGF